MERSGILRLVSRTLNGVNNVGDAAPGQSVLGYTGQVPQYSGQLGAIAELNFADAQAHSDLTPTTNYPLQGGRYMYVQYAADGTNYVQGQLLYWKDETNYIVTNVAPIATSARFAGFAIASVTQGNYWFAQTDGVAWALYTASPTDTTHTDVGVYAVVNTATVNALTDATADATAGVNKLYLGVNKDVAVGSTPGRIYMRGFPQAY